MYVQSVNPVELSKTAQRHHCKAEADLMSSRPKISTIEPVTPIFAATVKECTVSIPLAV